MQHDAPTAKGTIFAMQLRTFAYIKISRLLFQAKEFTQVEYFVQNYHLAIFHAT